MTEPAGTTASVRSAMLICFWLAVTSAASTLIDADRNTEEKRSLSPSWARSVSTSRLQPGRLLNIFLGSLLIITVMVLNSYLFLSLRLDPPRPAKRSLDSDDARRTIANIFDAIEKSF